MSAHTDDRPAFQKRGFLNEEFRLFHVRDLNGQTYRFHYHDFYKIMVLLEGNVNYVIEGRSYRLAPFDMVLVDRGAIHRPEVDPALPYERLILYLSPEFLTADKLSLCFSQAAYRHSSVLRMSRQDRRPLLDLLMRLEKSLEAGTEFAAPLYARLLCMEFMVLLNRLCLQPDSAYLTESAMDFRVAGLISHINSHLSEELTIPALAACCCMSPYHMMRLFKRETGYTIGNYICEKRLLKARELLSGGISATQACFASGFNSYSSFLRAYKKQFHGLPRRG